MFGAGFIGATLHLVSVPPRLPALANTVINDDQAGYRVRPPPAKPGIQQDADKDGRSESAVYQRDMRLG